MLQTIEGTVTDSMTCHFEGLTAEELISWAASQFGDELAMSTSFGIQSAVTLHLATRIKPDINVIWIDTGYLPEETYEYAATLTRRLGLNLQIYESPLSPADMEGEYGKLWESENVDELNLYDQIRKVEPMQRALDELNVRGWISGLRSQQTQHRAALPPVKRSGQRYRIYPILDWNNRDVYYYMEKHALPQHPLFEKGYTTVGDAHSSRPMSAGDKDERDTRFGGLKQECGLHL